MAEIDATLAVLRDKIWKTSKCRMRAEARYRRLHHAAHFFVAYYSLLIILASLFTAELLPLIPAVEKIVISLSIAAYFLRAAFWGLFWLLLVLFPFVVAIVLFYGAQHGV